MTNPISRHVKPLVLEALEDTRIVVIQGARQVGKTTLVQDIIMQQGGKLVTLDDDLTRAAAEDDPVGFASQNPGGLLAIDEVQRVPELILALKLIVDRDPRPGGFLLTGSADLLRLPTIDDSLAGRAESIELHGFSQGELSEHHERFIDRLFVGDRFLDHMSTLSRHDYLERAVVGSYPAVLARPTARRRKQWIENYIARVLERDAPDVSNIQRIAELPLLLRVLASRNSEELNIADIAKETGVPVSTLTRLVDLLETLYLIQRIPAWSTNLSKRAVSRPKISLLDTGVTAQLIGISAAGAAPGANSEAAGHLLEGFVAGELRRQRTWAEESVRISHFRDRAGGEVDFILETADGRIAGIEVKASATLTGKDSRWLAQFRDRLGARFIGGLVLHTGHNSAPFGDRIAAVPLDILWTA